jgi:GTPase SAR1 family protein
MAAQQILPAVPKYVKFRVLIIGRANAGKTSILQRICGTTEDPEVYKRDPDGSLEEVRYVASNRAFDLMANSESG